MQVRATGGPRTGAFVDAGGNSDRRSVVASTGRQRDGFDQRRERDGFDQRRERWPEKGLSRIPAVWLPALFPRLSRGQPIVRF